MNSKDYKWNYKQLLAYLDPKHIHVFDGTGFGGGYNANGVSWNCAVDGVPYYIVLLKARSWKFKLWLLAHELAHCCYIRGKKLFGRIRHQYNEVETDASAIQILEWVGIAAAKKEFACYWKPHMRKYTKVYKRRSI